MGWRLKRRLASVAVPGEEIDHLESLSLGGWWFTTDQALYLYRHSSAPDAPPSRIPFTELQSVRTATGPRVVVIRSRTGFAAAVAIRRRSKVLAHLQRLGY